MGYQITVDRGGCINCAVCMDLCPVGALDMTRPARAGIEASPTDRPLDWMMEYPVQVGECIGCSICVRECPTSVIDLTSVAGPTPLAPRQGPIHHVQEEVGWIPLSAVTRESLKETKGSPFEPLAHWQTRDRPKPWQSWNSKGKPVKRPAALAPCQAACPAGTDAGRYVGLIAAGRYDEAYAVAAEVNPFPSVCGWICTAPCESVCRRGVLDEPISIRNLKRFAAEHGTLPPVEPPRRRRSERVAIVGGGPAGMSAAYYLARLGYGVTVFEAMPVPGGMMAIGIPAYRLPRETLRAEIDQILGLGVELKLDAVMGRDFNLSDLEGQGFEAIFLATGASKSRRLGVPGDELDGVIPATLFLKRVNLEEPSRLTGTVLVVGGGSTAMDAARSAWRCGADKVIVLYRRSRGEMRAQAEEIEAAEAEGIEIRTDAVVTEVVGERGAVKGLRVIQGPAGETSRFSAAETSAVETSAAETLEHPRSSAAEPGSGVVLEATTILVAIGEEGDPSILPPGTGIEMSTWAGIVADPQTLATGHPGVFAGGDVVSGPKTIIDAVAGGRRAAGAIHEYLSGAVDGETEILATVRYRTQREPELRLDLATRARVQPSTQSGANRTGVRSFAPTHPGLDEAAARVEAARCFRCDAVYGCSTVHLVAGRGPGFSTTEAAQEAGIGSTPRSPAELTAIGGRP